MPHIMNGRVHNQFLNNLIKGHYSKLSSKVPNSKENFLVFPGSMHINKLCPKYLQSLKKFCEVLKRSIADKLSITTQYMAKILSLKGLEFQGKKRNLNFLVICTFTQCKVSRNSVQWFKRSLPYIKRLCCK